MGKESSPKISQKEHRNSAFSQVLSDLMNRRAVGYRQLSDVREVGKVALISSLHRFWKMCGLTFLMLFPYARNEFEWMTWGWWKLIFQRNSSSVHLRTTWQSNRFLRYPISITAIYRQKTLCGQATESALKTQIYHFWKTPTTPVASLVVSFTRTSFLEFSTTASTSSLSPGFFFNIYTLARKIDELWYAMASLPLSNSGGPMGRAKHHAAADYR